MAQPPDGEDEALRAAELWNERVGPFYDIASITESLGASPNEVRVMIDNGVLLGLPISDDQHVFPARQFGPHMELLPGLPEVLTAMRSNLDPWGTALWLLQASPDFEGLTPVEMMRAGRLAPVLEAARELGKFWDG